MTDAASVELATADEMARAGAVVGATLAAGDVLVLTGPLGAGKTTFTRGLGAALGIRGPVTSPTFVLARTHPSLVGGPELIHVDAYRLGDPAELDDLGLDIEASVTVVEWGRAAVPLLVDRWLEVTIERARAGGSAPETAEEDDDEPLDPRWLTLSIEGAAPRAADAARFQGIADALLAEFGSARA